MASSEICKVFIDSSNDLAVERQAFLKAIELLNLGHTDDAKARLLPMGWEDPLAATCPQTEAIINEEIDSCDVFILVLHQQWGQKAPSSEYSSFTEEQFRRAQKRYNKTGHPAIFVYFKGVVAASLAAPGSQLQKIIGFKLELEETGSILYKQYHTENEFTHMLDNHLKAYLKGEIRPENMETFRATLSLQAKEEIREAQKMLAEAEQRINILLAQEEGFARQVAAAEKSSIELSHNATAFALEGKLEHARVQFAQALQPSNLAEVMNIAVNFYINVEDLNEAENLLHRMLAQFSEFDASALVRRLGILLYSRGDLDQAEAMFRKSLESEEKLGHLEEVAISYRNLGVLFQTRGNLDQAEAMFRKSLKIEEKLGRLDGMSNIYCNLGVLCKARGNLDQAEAMFRKSLKIEEKLGRLDGMSNIYCNLGVLFLARRDLDQAEVMFRKSLKMEEKLGRPEGIASNLCNLGVLFRSRGDLAQAEEMHRKSLKMEESLGFLVGMASNFCNLGNIFLTRGDFDQAEAMFRKSLKMERNLGRPEGIASNLCNLGVLFQARGDLDQAEAMHRKSLGIREKLGHLKEMAGNYSNLGNIFLARGDFTQADAMHRKSREA
ncbi:MAG: tetratricopeptide repeat protein [Geobacteraceae bacterium]|nr:tetratricopeptide repeat protein [Geobacteraceae bacterium]